MNPLSKRDDGFHRLPEDPGARRRLRLIAIAAVAAFVVFAAWVVWFTLSSELVFIRIPMD